MNVLLELQERARRKNARIVLPEAGDERKRREERADESQARADADEAARRAEREVRLLETLGAGPDHPQRPDFGRSRYLKGLILAVD